MTDPNQSVLSEEQIKSVIALYSSGKYQEAIKQIKILNEVYPNVPLLFNLVGVCYKALGELEGSVKMFEMAVSLKSDYTEAHKNLGIVFKDLGQFDAAIESFKTAIFYESDYEDAHYNLANTLKDSFKFDDAVKSYKKAIEINPSLEVAYNNLGNILVTDFNKLEEASLCFEKAIEINPNFAEAYSNLGNLMRELNRLDEALSYYESAIKLQPNLDNALGSILRTKLDFCHWDNFTNYIDDLKEKIVNNEKVVNPFVLLALIDDSALQLKVSELTINIYHPKNDLLSIIKNHPHHHKIKIGYFSADFREHPVSYLTAELYEVHNRDQFEIHAFSFGPDTKDEMNLRIKAGVDHFHNVRSMSHQEITLLARSLEIDIAVDLTGHTAESRTDVFAMSAAPIQLSYIGYLGSMGAEYYDYLIADPVMIPKESQKYYVEKIVYLPSFQVNDSKDLPPDIVLTRKDVGLPDNGFVFCCFNNTYKMTPTTFDSWARILQAVEGSVLIIFANNDLSKANLTKEIKRRGVDSDRLIFGDSLSRPEYLARFRVADLFLDTQPYNAGTTASDALKMGLPMLTLKGEAYQARMGASIVNALKLPELITTSSEEYESLAIELATNPEKMKAIKDKLASNLSTAPLFDTKLFTKNLESAYTEMYERYHKGLEPDHIYVES